MEHLYNPEQMSEQEIKDTFVARTALVERLVDTVRQQGEGAGVQHVVLVGPRGMGKTTVLLMVQFAVQKMGSDSPWLAIKFPEELYGVNDLADFWLETLDSLSNVAQDKSLENTIASLKQKYPDSQQLQEAAVAALRGWCREHGRRLLLLVDNFNQILSQINDEQQNAALRNVLMNEGFLMILGAAPSFFKEASNYDEPLYNFFKIEHLNRISFEDTLELMRRRAKIDGLVEFGQVLDSNTARLKALDYFTGGNVRLILMLYHVVSKSALFEVRQGLEKLLDQVTPFFKAKTEDLPPQQRKILDHIARTTSQTHEGVSPSEIAKSVRMTQQTVSAQLKRLAEQGYVESANLRGRSSFYVLSEPLYSLWYQMRFGRNSRQRVSWLINFLKAWYDESELNSEAHQLEERFQKLLNDGDIENARMTLENHNLITQAIGDEFKLAYCLSTLIRGYMALDDTLKIREVLNSFEPGQFDIITLDLLGNAGYLDSERSEILRDGLPECTRLAQEGVELLSSRDFEQFLQNADRQIELISNWFGGWYAKAIALRLLERPEEALICINRAMDLDPKHPDSFLERALVYKTLNQPDSAMDDLDTSLRLNPDHSSSLYCRGLLLSELGRHNEAVPDFQATVAQKPQHLGAWLALAESLEQVGKHQMSVHCFDKALEIEPNKVAYMLKRLPSLLKMEQFDEYIKTIDRIIKLDTDAICIADQPLGLQQALHKQLEALQGLKNTVQRLKSSIALHKVFPALRVLNEFMEAYKNNNLDIAKQKWSEAIALGAQWDQLPVGYKISFNIERSWQEDASGILIAIALEGKEAYVRELIALAEGGDIFFPLARALDYISTKDEALIEKLTPEMRPIVDEVIKKLRPS